MSNGISKVENLVEILFKTFLRPFCHWTVTLLQNPNWFAHQCRQGCKNLGPKVTFCVSSGRCPSHTIAFSIPQTLSEGKCLSKVHWTLSNRSRRLDLWKSSLNGSGNRFSSRGSNWNNWCETLECEWEKSCNYISKEKDKTAPSSSVTKQNRQKSIKVA